MHGGASPRTTWAGLEPLSARWSLGYVHRRGYPPSPPVDPRQDFDVDADDLEPLLAGRPHLVMHSYGSLGSLIAAARVPEEVRSLTVIEPPLGQLIAGDPDADRLVQLGDEVLTHGMDTEPSRVREFLHIAGAPLFGPGPLPDDVAAGVRRAHGSRLASEARPPLRVLREAGVPALVASGDHHAGLEKICDHVADELGADRVAYPGAGHFVPAAPGFAERLERFLDAVS